MVELDPTDRLHEIHRARTVGDERWEVEDFEDAFEGRQVELQVDTTAPCEPCSGSGAKPGTSARTCGTCGGRGQVRARQGFFVVEQTCPACRGACAPR